MDNLQLVYRCHIAVRFSFIIGDQPEINQNGQHAKCLQKSLIFARLTDTINYQQIFQSVASKQPLSLKQIQQAYIQKTPNKIEILFFKSCVLLIAVLIRSIELRISKSI